MTAARLAGRAVVALLALAIAVVGLTATRVWWTARQDDRRPSDAIVVLGAGQYDGRPSKVFEYRLRHARTLYRQGVATHVITVGGKQLLDRTTEAAAGRGWLTAHGVPAARVVAVGAGADTYDSLVAARPVLRRHGWHSLVVVSDPWHSLRAGTMASDLGFDTVTSPVHSGPITYSRTTEMRYVTRETGAYLYYEIERHTGVRL